LVTFDLSAVPLAQRTNIVMASIDAAGQILTATKTQQILIDADHYESVKSKNVAAEVAAVKQHLADLTVIVSVDPFDAKDVNSLAISRSYEYGHTLRLNKAIFDRHLEDFAFARYISLQSASVKHYYECFLLI